MKTTMTAAVAMAMAMRCIPDGHVRFESEWCFGWVLVTLCAQCAQRAQSQYVDSTAGWPAICVAKVGMHGAARTAAPLPSLAATARVVRVQLAIAKHVS